MIDDANPKLVKITIALANRLEAFGFDGTIKIKLVVSVQDKESSQTDAVVAREGEFHFE